MISTSKNRLVSKILGLSLLGLPLAACEGAEGNAEGDPPTASAPAAAVGEESREVISIVVDSNGAEQRSTVRMRESEWQQIVKQRLAGAAAPEGTGSAAAPVARIQQAFTVLGTCGSSSSTWFFSGNSFSGTVACLKQADEETNLPYVDRNVGFAVHSTLAGSNAARALLCTSDSDCNLWQCGYGRSVWFDAGGAGAAYTNIPQPPSNSFMTPHWVHMQLGTFTGCD